MIQVANPRHWKLQYALASTSIVEVYNLDLFPRSVGNSNWWSKEGKETNGYEELIAMWVEENGESQKCKKCKNKHCTGGQPPRFYHVELIESIDSNDKTIIGTAYWNPGWDDYSVDFLFQDELMGMGLSAHPLHWIKFLPCAIWAGYDLGLGLRKGKDTTKLDDWNLVESLRKAWEKENPMPPRPRFEFGSDGTPHDEWIRSFNCHLRDARTGITKPYPHSNGEETYDIGVPPADSIWYTDKGFTLEWSFKGIKNDKAKKFHEAIFQTMVRVLPSGGHPDLINYRDLATKGNCAALTICYDNGEEMEVA